MKSVGRLTKILGYTLAVAALLAVSTVQAAVNKAVIRAVRGTAQVDVGNKGAWKPAKVGMSLTPNSTVKTADASTVDLFLGDNGPVVRVTASTSLGIDKLNVDGTGIEKVIDTELDLRNGRILGNVKKMAAASKYEVKTPVGVAGIRGTEYDISADGAVHVVSGTVVVVYVRADGTLAPPVTVNAGQSAMPPTTPNGVATVVQTSSLGADVLANIVSSTTDVRNATTIYLATPDVVVNTTGTTTGNTGTTGSQTTGATGTVVEPQPTSP